MKKNVLLLAILLPTMGFLTHSRGPISEKERKFAINLLEQSEKDLNAAISGLTPEQLAFKPDTDRWSVSDCVKHIAVTEGALWSMYQASMKENPDSSRRAEVKVTDEQFI